MARSAPGERSRSDEGFTLIEVVVAVAVFAVLATAFAAVLNATMRSFTSSKVRTLAEQVASSQLEDARRLAYDDIGTTSGNPPGLIAPTRTVTNAGLTLNVATRVSYVNDPVPNATETGADYKSVRVTVTSPSVPTLNVQMQTFVAPPDQPSLSKALVKVQVVDYVANTVVPNATVSISGGPSAARSDTTDAAGSVTFAALDPNPASGSQAKYNVTVSAPGYVVLASDLPPSTAATRSLSAGQKFETTLRIFKPVTLNVHLVNPSGTAFTANANVSFSSSDGSGSVAVTGGNTSITQLGGNPIIPGQFTVGATSPGYFGASWVGQVPATYPTVLTRDVNIVMQPVVTTGTLQVTVKDTTNKNIANAVVLVTGGPGAVALTGTTNSSGVVSFTVPSGTSPVYTIAAVAQLGYGPATTTKAGPSGSGSVSVTLTVTKL
jgi:prepilin-type N-terminal cleavage/methylation domain-containing protein